MTQILNKSYLTKADPLTGSSWNEVAPKARALFKALTKHTKRRPYIRSAYFKKDKIFLTFFWQHLSQKTYPNQLRRMKYLPCAIELVRNSRFHPTSMQNPNKPAETLHRFSGITKSNKRFMVQIKEFKQTGRKELMSIFPYD